jgi:glycosyltransferase involved in cell wall biosynthesis
MQSRILSVGRLVPRKGHTYLIEAIKKLVAEGLDIKLVIVGFGPEKERLAKQAEGLNCEIRSELSEDEVNQEYQKADIFVLPSVTDNQGEKEGLGLVSLEAMSFNVPVVAFDNGGVGEVVIDGKTGILLPERDVDGLAKAIKRLLTDQLLRQKLTSQATEYAKATFTTKILADQQAEIYHQVLEKKAI